MGRRFFKIDARLSSFLISGPMFMSPSPSRDKSSKNLDSDVTHGIDLVQSGPLWDISRAITPLIRALKRKKTGYSFMRSLKKGVPGPITPCILSHQLGPNIPASPTIADNFSKSSKGCHICRETPETRLKWVEKMLGFLRMCSRFEIRQNQGQLGSDSKELVGKTFIFKLSWLVFVVVTHIIYAYIYI